MLIKFIRATRGPAVALQYCMATHDDGGQPRHVHLVRGSPMAFLSTARRLAFHETYKSCVIAWRAGDAPSWAQLDALINDFERLAFAGLSVHRFAMCVFLHVPILETDTKLAHKGVDLHLLVATCDLATGKHFNAAVSWMNRFRPLQDKYNYMCGWSRPEDPRNARSTGHIQSAPFVAWRRRNGLDEPKKTDKQSILDAVWESMEQGLLKSRSDLLDVMGTRCQTVLQVEDGVTAVSLAGRHLHFRGQVFLPDFDFAQPPMPRQKRRRTSDDQQRDRDPVKAKQSAKDLEKMIECWTLINRRRYAPDVPLLQPANPTPISLSLEERESELSLQASNVLNAATVLTNVRLSSVEAGPHEHEPNVPFTINTQNRHENPTGSDASTFLDRFQCLAVSIIEQLERQVQRWRRIVAITERAVGRFAEEVVRERRRAASARAELDRAIDGLDESMQRIARQADEFGSRMGNARRARASVMAIDRASTRQAREPVAENKRRLGF